MACRVRPCSAPARVARTREESDLDLLVDTAETTGIFALAAFKREAGTLPGAPVSVLTPGALPLKSRNAVLQQAQAL